MNCQQLFACNFAVLLAIIIFSKVKIFQNVFWGGYFFLEHPVLAMADQ